MANRPRALNPAQRAALDNVAQQHARRLSEIPVIKARLKRQEIEETEGLDLALALAVRRAFELGVPKRQIGMIGMDTSDPGTPNKWLQRTEALVAAQSTEREPFTPNPDGTVTVRIPHFQTAAKVTEGYPDVLEGVVRRDENAVSGWAVMTDPGDVHGELGVTPGWLTWELGRPADAPHSLPGILNEWGQA